jgi:Immunity protein 53
MSSSEIIVWFETFYASYCDGDREHQSGVTITTLDNPGWSVTVEIEGTALERVAFSRVEIERSEHDWVQCWVQGSKWQGRGGPHNLREILETFRHWVESSKTPS